MTGKDGGDPETSWHAPAGGWPARASLSGRLLPFDAKPRHAALESGWFESQPLGRAAGAANAPVGALQHAANVLDLQVGESQVDWRGRSWRRQPRRRHHQLTAGGDNHGTFDDVAQLTDVSGPRIALQLAQAVL